MIRVTADAPARRTEEHGKNTRRYTDWKLKHASLG